MFSCMLWNRYVTFLCGQPGIYALGAAAAKCRGDQQHLEHYLGLFNEVTCSFKQDHSKADASSCLILFVVVSFIAFRLLFCCYKTSLQ